MPAQSKVQQPPATNAGPPPVYKPVRKYKGDEINIDLLVCNDSGVNYWAGMVGTGDFGETVARQEPDDPPPSARAGVTGRRVEEKLVMALIGPRTVGQRVDTSLASLTTRIAQFSFFQAATHMHGHDGITGMTSLGTNPVHPNTSNHLGVHVTKSVIIWVGEDDNENSDNCLRRIVQWASKFIRELIAAAQQLSCRDRLHSISNSRTKHSALVLTSISGVGAELPSLRQRSTGPKPFRVENDLRMN
ncbi:hypothetical protein DFH07DRAFT_776615 [Mycena maculata]|uniref:Uncharacterized protein n=1 Tax=Mycena maculata TaxID=230809 RepID=A0AAD7ILF6_9AGAR|nr:hypothetical protein DFH07DRAFT_776615 [Mycena maculata]